MDNLREFKDAKAELEDILKGFLNTFNTVWGCSVVGVDIKNSRCFGDVTCAVQAVSVKVEI